MVKYAFKISFNSMILRAGMHYLGCRVYQIWSNDDSRMTLSYLTPRSKLLLNAFNNIRGNNLAKLIFQLLLKPKS